MRSGLAIRLPLLLGIVLVPPAATASAKATRSARAQEIDAREIVERAVARFARQGPAENQFEAVVETITEFLDAAGQVEKTERETHRQYPVEGILYEELIAKDGQPLDEEETLREAERREEFAEEVRKRRRRDEPPLPEDDERIELNQEFIDRYVFSLAGEETIDGEPVWVLDLEPREGELPVRRRIDHALNNSTGTLWISRRDYGLSRVRFEMREPVRFWGGILGTLRSTVGEIEFARVAPDVWLPTGLDIRFDLRVLFSNIRRRMVREWGEYSRALAD